ncbi:hypothetical protein [Cupriavidus numazuensis]|uniref:Uncharacterized protein n=1 Tax=Cupriavidus numazuensis TaxID=221992 RepID=A0ABM8T9V1_9BURK|nr:hypothetical protein [Cupriavidus numazuensis]CAG2129230.1 hypothetical protein LMG26411_00141 [Cupriavidus numazuensis]
MDLPIQSIESLRAEGRAAAVRGERLESNPYLPRYGSHYRQWEHGHDWAVIAMIDNVEGD